MNVLSRLYQGFVSRPAPAWLQRSNLGTLVWRVGRKWLNVSIIPFIPFNNIRIWGYRLVGFRIGRNCFIGMQCYLDDMYPQRLVIEDDVVVSYRVTFACHGPRSADHRLILREGCYIGTNATLLGGLGRGDIEIGPYATVGAGSLVSRSVAALATVIGIPAKTVRTTRQPWGSDHDKAEILRRRYLGEPAPMPDIRPHGGEFAQTVVAILSCAGDEQVMIRYTEDGSEPTEESPLYQGSIVIQASMSLCARSFKPGHFPSQAITAIFTIT